VLHSRDRTGCAHSSPLERPFSFSVQFFYRSGHARGRAVGLNLHSSLVVVEINLQSSKFPRWSRSICNRATARGGRDRSAIEQLLAVVGIDLQSSNCSRWTPGNSCFEARGVGNEVLAAATMSRRRRWGAHGRFRQYDDD
jgi:hypothetical protein